MHRTSILAAAVTVALVIGHQPAQAAATHAKCPAADAIADPLQKAQEQLKCDLPAFSQDQQDYGQGKITSDKLDGDKQAITDDRVTIAQNTPPGGVNPICLNSKAFNSCAALGAMIIPFRAELSGKKDVFGGVSADLFVGFNFWGDFLGLSFLPIPEERAVTFLVYAGYLPTFNTTNASAGTTGNGSGAVDFGAGFSFPVWDLTQTKVVHVGAVVGFDVTSGSNKFAYNGKPYISVFAGLSF